MIDSKKPLTPSYERVSDSGNNGGNGGNNAPTTPASKVAPVPTEEKVTFTPAQQAKIDEIIRVSMGRAGSEARQALTAANNKIAELNKSLEKTLKAASPDATEADKLRVELDAAKMRLSDLTTEHQNERLHSAILSAASAEKFVDPSQAALLLDRAGLYHEDGSIDSTKVSEAVKVLAQSSPHLIRGDVRTGAGSTPANNYPAPTLKVEEFFGRGSNASLANRLALRQPEQYKSLRREAVKRGLI